MLDPNLCYPKYEHWIQNQLLVGVSKTNIIGYILTYYLCWILTYGELTIVIPQTSLSPIVCRLPNSVWMFTGQNLTNPKASCSKENDDKQGGLVGSLLVAYFHRNPYGGIQYFCGKNMEHLS